MPVMIFSQLAGLITLLLVLPFLPPATATHADFTWGALAGGALAMGLMLLYQGLATGKMSVVAPVTAVLAVMVSATTGIVLGDRLSLSAFLGVALGHHGNYAHQSRRRAESHGKTRTGHHARSCRRAFGRGPGRRVLRYT
jgi:drug/metabolite transporter (DMT)-like permease